MKGRGNINNNFDFIFENNINSYIDYISVDDKTTLNVLFEVVYINKELELTALKDEIKIFLLRKYQQDIGVGVRGTGVRGVGIAWVNKEVDNIIDNLIYDKENDVSIIEVVEVSNNIKGKTIKYFKLTDYGKDLFWNPMNNEDYTYIYNILDKIDIFESHRYDDGYTLAIKQHTTLEHYHCINVLRRKCIEENISHSVGHESTRKKIDKGIDNIKYRNNKAVEFDLIMRYRNKQIAVEVERGTTWITDMRKKIMKINELAKGNSKYRYVIVAAPNSIELKNTKDKIDISICGLEEEGIDINIDILYLNLSNINKKNTIRRFLNENIKKRDVE